MGAFLYFTRSNGDVDSRPHNPKLNTDAKKRKEIGDNGAKNFVVISENFPPRPAWDDVLKTYVASIDKEEVRDGSAFSPVNYNGVDVRYSPLLLEAARDNRNETWIVHDNNGKKWKKTYTPTDLKAIKNLFRNQIRAAYDTYMEDLEEYNG